MIELIGSDENVKLSTKQLDELALLLKREETLLLEDQIERALEKQLQQEEFKDESKVASKVSACSMNERLLFLPRLFKLLTVTSCGRILQILLPHRTNQKNLRKTLPAPHPQSSHLAHLQFH